MITLVLSPILSRGELPREFFFTVHNMNTGMPSDQVNSIIQDQDGYLWIGTTDGLIRYDGIRYRNFRHEQGNPRSIPSNPVMQVMQASDGNIWVLLADGKLGLFNTSSLQYQEVRINTRDERGVRMGAKQLLGDEFGNVFLLVMGMEVLKWNAGKRSFEPIYDFIPLNRSWIVHYIAQQPGTQKYWLSVSGPGIVIYDRETNKMSYNGHNEAKEPMIDAYANVPDASRFTFDKKGKVWFTTWGSGFPMVYCYDLRNRIKVLEKFEYITALKSYNEVSGFFVQSDSTVWVKGLKTFSYYDEKKNALQLVDEKMPGTERLDFSEVTCIYEDREQNLWVGSRISGMYRFNPSKQYFTNIGHINRITGKPGDGNVMSFISDRDGSILAGAWGDGLYRYDSNFNPMPLDIDGIGKNNNLSVWNIHRSRNSKTIWMSCQPGLFAYDQESRKAVYYNPPALENRTIRQVVEDKKGKLWLGIQWRGIFLWEPNATGQWQNAGIRRHPNIPDVHINHISIDHAGLVWVSTPTDGAYAFDPDTDSTRYHFQKNGQDAFMLPEDGASSVLPYNDSLVVITTATRILLFNKKSVTTKTIGRPDFISGFIAATQKDDAGNLWVSTTSSLYRINIFKNLFIQFDKQDGINHDNFVLAASYKMPDGRLLFGAESQFIVLNPKSLLVSEQTGNLRIADFKVMNQSLPLDSLLRLDQITLGYRDNSIVIDFTPLSFINPPLVQYRLDGLETSWNRADKDYQAVYSYLPPGTYTLEFNTIDEERRIRPDKLKIRIRVEPPFWKSWWFYSLVGLVTMMLLFWIDRMRIQKIRDEQRMRTSIAGQLHHDVQNTLQNINVLSEIAAMKSSSKPQEAAGYIRDIQTKSRDMVMSMKDVLWSIDPANDSMTKTIERMHE